MSHCICKLSEWDYEAELSRSRTNFLVDEGVGRVGYEEVVLCLASQVDLFTSKLHPAKWVTLS